MQLRCSYCQTMFATSRDADLVAIQKMEAEGLHHHDAHCPKCRRANSIARDRLERAYPNWRKELKARQQEAQKETEKETEKESKKAS